MIRQSEKVELIFLIYKQKCKSLMNNALEFNKGYFEINN